MAFLSLPGVSVSLKLGMVDGPIRTKLELHPEIGTIAPQPLAAGRIMDFSVDPV